MRLGGTYYHRMARLSDSTWKDEASWWRMLGQRGQATYQIVSLLQSSLYLSFCLLLLVCVGTFFEICKASRQNVLASESDLLQPPPSSQQSLADLCLMRFQISATKASNI